MLTKTQIAGIKRDLKKDGENLAPIFRALGDGGRLKILKLLMTHHDLCVTDVANVFGMTVSAASQQLRVLERLGLVEKMRMGQMVCYELKKENPVVKKLVQFLRSSD